LGGRAPDCPPPNHHRANPNRESTYKIPIDSQEIDPILDTWRSNSAVPEQGEIMTKSEKNEVSKILQTPHFAILVREMSKLVSAAKSPRSRRELIAVAARYGAHKSPEFIINN